MHEKSLANGSAVIAIDQAPDRAHRQFLKPAVVFASIALFLVVGVGLLNFIVDPLDVHSHEIVPARARNTRTEMINLIDTWPKESTAIVIGSSRSLGVPLEVVSETTGLPARRIATAGMKFEEYLMYLKWAVEVAEIDVKSVVVAVDAFSVLTGKPNPESLRETRLQNVAPNWYPSYGVRDFYEDWKNNFSLDRLTISGNGLRLIAMGGPPKRIAFSEREAQGTKLDETGVSNVVELWLVNQGALDYRSVDQRRLDEFAKLFEYAEANSIELRAFITPVHPLFLTRLEAEHRDVAVARIMGSLNERLDPTKYRLFDFTDLATFGGTSKEFEDGSHFTIVNGELIVGALFEDDSR